MSLNQFFDYINGIAGERPKHIRLGQHAANLLYEAYPNVYESIRGTYLDPFYEDSIMQEFLIYILTYYVE